MTEGLCSLDVRTQIQGRLLLEVDHANVIKYIHTAFKADLKHTN